MDDLTDRRAPATAPEYDGFAFRGRWQEFLPIVATNLLLTIVTLGFYRFWAKARERRYLWGETVFVDDRLEWTGTGREMFVGFLIVMAVFIPLGLIVQFGLPAMIARGYGLLAGVLSLIVYIGFFYMIGVARFRAIRYRISRTRWHGVRGGSDQGGWGYGGQALVSTIFVGLTAGLLQPWAMATLWRARFGAMSFGDAPIGVGEGPIPKGLFARWFLIYVAFVGIMIALFAMTFGAVLGGMIGEDADSGAVTAVSILIGVFVLYLTLPVLFVTYYAKYVREMVGEMSWMNLDFTFTASTWDWIKLYLGHALLVIVTLGFGYLFIGYRNWAFFVRHLEARGTLDIDLIRQSETRMRTDAEGLADAFDIGAI
ncbi:MAG: YjgN family protein [Pseudomonadota bacterium]